MINVFNHIATCRPAAGGMALFILITILSQSLFSQIITVKKDGSGNYQQIQDAINGSENGDTVLVWPGTYFENILFNGKSITLASLNLTTGDEQYIHQTIIDGSYESTCILIDEYESVHICGFTVTHGSGVPGHLPEGEVGGGIFFRNNSVSTLENCIVTENEVTGWGGGVSGGDDIVYMKGVVIKNNQAYLWGGGLWASRTGKLLSFEFDSINRCSIFSNYSGRGCDIYKTFTYDTLHLYLDTFSVMQPDIYHIWESDSLGHQGLVMDIDILNAKIETVAADLYVSPAGDNNNSGLTISEPLQTIAYALSKIEADADNIRTIHLSNGLYSEASNDEKFPINLRSYVNLTGEDKNSTILDADSLCIVMNGNKETKQYTISNLTLQKGYGSEKRGAGILLINLNENAVFENMIIKDGSNWFKSALNTGSSWEVDFRNTHIYNNFRGYKTVGLISAKNPEMYLQTDTVTFENCRIYNNGPGEDLDSGPGGAYFLGGNLLFDTSVFVGRILNCEIVNNLEINTPGFMGACAILAYNNVTSYVVNSTIADNQCFSDPRSHAVGIQDQCDMHIYNSIIYGNTPRQLGLTGDGTFPSYMYVYHSVIEGGEEEVFNTTPLNILYYDESNIEENPQFLNSGDFPYALQSTSPCIDAGTLELPPEVYLPEYDLAGNPRIYGGTIDMGAYEWSPVHIDEYSKSQTATIKYLKVFPNPFRHTTSISFDNPGGGDVKVAVYDLKGNLAGIVYDTPSAPNKATFWWDGKGTGGAELPAGIYLVVLEINGKRTGSQKVSKN